MLAKTLTSRDFLRIRSSELLNNGALSLSPEARWEQAISAKSMRNFWFTASSAPITTAGTGLAVVLGAQTPRFSEPVIITDVLSMFDFKSNNTAVSAMVSRFFLQLILVGSGDASSGVDLFGLTGQVGAEFITKHEKNYSQLVTVSNGINVLDTQPKWLPFVPRLLRPYDFIQARWGLSPPVTDDPFFVGWYNQIGFRGVRVLPIDSPYRYVFKNAAERIQNYIASNAPETFLMEVKFPLADVIGTGGVGGAGVFAIKTPQMGRPLLILGATTNLEGAQAALIEEGSYYEFTKIDKRNDVNTRPGTYTAVPLSLWAANSDFRNTNLYNMWPVPHLLEPGDQLRIELTDGLYPNQAGPFEVLASTRNDQDARITFICRTV